MFVLRPSRRLLDALIVALIVGADAGAFLGSVWFAGVGAESVGVDVSWESV